MEIPITIYTDNRQLIFDLLEQDSVSSGTEKQLKNGLTVRYDYTKIRKAFGIPEMTQITLIMAKPIAEGVLAGLITAWLLEKLGKDDSKVTKLEIDRITVELDENKIKKIVTEKIRKTD